MNFRVALAVATLVIPGPAFAVCVIEPLGPKLKSAQVVYVGTVTSSKLAAPLGADHSDRPDGAVKVIHTVEPQLILKGEPVDTPSVASWQEYNDPRSEIRVDVAELLSISPGHNLLVVVDGTDEVTLGMCTASRRWDDSAQKAVRDIFGRAP